MKRLSVVVLCVAVALSFSTTFAQNNEPESVRTKALSFTFNSLKLDSFNGGLGGKYWLSDGMASNAGIIFNKSGSREKSQNKDYSDEEISNSILGIFAGLEMHLNSTGKVSPYFGGQLGISTSRILHKPSVYKQNEKTEKKTSLSSFNLVGTIGVEYWFAKSLSLAGQYTFGFSSGSGKSERTTGSTTKTTNEISTSSFGIATSSLILSIYF